MGLIYEDDNSHKQEAADCIWRDPTAEEQNNMATDTGHGDHYVVEVYYK